jgi:hypothetical protein
VVWGELTCERTPGIQKRVEKISREGAREQRSKDAKGRAIWRELGSVIVDYSVPKELLHFLKPYDPAVRDLAVKLRQLVLEELAPCHENIYDAYSAVAIGYGPTDRLRDGICHIAVYSVHVNLGFNFGAALADPEKILLGSGKLIRHLKIADIADLSAPALRLYLREARRVASEDARSLGETLAPQPHGVISTVKAIYPRKRRPTATKKKVTPRKSR